MLEMVELVAKLQLLNGGDAGILRALSDMWMVGPNTGVLSSRLKFT